MAAGAASEVSQILGKLRIVATDIIEKNGRNVRAEGYHFAWIKNFPLFEKSNGGKLESAHHPFTAPLKEDEYLIFSNPERVRGNHYDLVLNGFEVGGGSIRNHDSALQRHIIEKILLEDSSTLEHLLNALDMGAPPHGGIALGLDRILAVLCNVKSIKEVIAFPKTNEGRDLMSDSPALLTEDEEEYYLKNYVSNRQLREKSAK